MESELPSQRAARSDAGQLDTIRIAVRADVILVAEIVVQKLGAGQDILRYRVLNAAADRPSDESRSNLSRYDCCDRSALLKIKIRNGQSARHEEKPAVSGVTKTSAHVARPVHVVLVGQLSCDDDRGWWDDRPGPVRIAPAEVAFNT